MKENRPRFAVYTCASGNYDEDPCAPADQTEIDYIRFSDQYENLKGWRCINILTSYNSKDTNRNYKINVHNIEILNKYDITLYIDGNIAIKPGIIEFFLRLQDTDFDIAIYKHPERDCIFDEADVCARFAHDWIWKISKQVNMYRSNGYLPHSGLFEANIIARRNSDNVSRLMQLWWNEYITGIKRDQISLPYLSWIAGVPILELSNVTLAPRDKYFSKIPHKSKRIIQINPRYVINNTLRRLIPSSRPNQTKSHG